MNLADERTDRTIGSTGPTEESKRGPVRRLIVTIDGPAGTGKSSVAREVARRLDLFVLDTGAMYRAVAWLANRESLDPTDEASVLAAMEKHALKPSADGDRTVVTVGGVDPGESLRGQEVEGIVSIIAALPGVRDRLVEAQQEFAGRHSRIVTEGRDQGSVVFPDATAKFFLTASPEVRARRRVKQIVRGGGEADIEEILKGIESRDRLDATRTEGPLVRPEDSVEIDTDSLGREAVTDRIVQLVRAAAARDSGPGDEGSVR
ncbi:MAG: (d)CMP kinase [Phycisphaera sp.]|nr:(d)CMP kinase [Phycisphaera sp.]